MRLLQRPGRRGVAAAGTSLLVVAVLVGVMALPAAATDFSNTGAITIPAAGTSGVAAPYPSAIAVSGLTGNVTDVNVTVTNFNHTWPGDVDVLLVGPFGQNVVLLANTGGSTDAVGVNLTFDDGAAGTVPTPVVSGTFRPTNNGAFSGPAPAPAPPYSAALSIFNGTSPNGTWKLFVFDDAGGDVGNIGGGWTLSITTNGPTITSFNPTTGPPGTSVVIIGTNFTGATQVTFGGHAATTFTVDSATQVTATVPAGAVTGPVAVTTPAGVATSSTNYTVTPPPTVTSFTPTSGEVGDAVVITGTNFTGASAVRFNGIAASIFTVDSPTQITATIPAGAGAGPISVTTAGGTGTSSSDFVVIHPRNVSLTLSRRKAKGSVNATDGFSKCTTGVPVKVQHRENGSWQTVGSALTNTSSRYSVGGVSDPGKYRSFAEEIVTAEGDVCLAATSPKASH